AVRVFGGARVLAPKGVRLPDGLRRQEMATGKEPPLELVGILGSLNPEEKSGKHDGRAERAAEPHGAPASREFHGEGRREAAQEQRRARGGPRDRIEEVATVRKNLRVRGVHRGVDPEEPGEEYAVDDDEQTCPHPS